jgi:predicted nuclease of predicted toxin-antitoxin system
MRFLVDACAGPAVADWLYRNGHEAVSVHDDVPPPDDATLLARARHEALILVATDKGFGERVVRHRKPHAGIILLRLDDERTANKLDVMARLLEQHHDGLPGASVVVTERRVRFVR